jgi:hypothetical protein
LQKPHEFSRKAATRHFTIVIVAFGAALGTGMIAVAADDVRPAALEELEIPETDINFGDPQSISHRPPPTGPLLHRAFARRWKESFEANVAKAAAMVALAERGAATARSAAGDG